MCGDFPSSSSVWIVNERKTERERKEKKRKKSTFFRVKINIYSACALRCLVLEKNVAGVAASLQDRAIWYCTRTIVARVNRLSAMDTPCPRRRRQRQWCYYFFNNHRSSGLPTGFTVARTSAGAAGCARRLRVKFVFLVSYQIQCRLHACFVIVAALAHHLGAHIMLKHHGGGIYRCVRKRHCSAIDTILRDATTTTTETTPPAPIYARLMPTCKRDGGKCREIGTTRRGGHFFYFFLFGGKNFPFFFH